MPSPTSKRTKTPKPTAEPTPAAAPEIRLADLLEKERAASERGVDMLERCIAEVETMLASGEYDSKLASHLAWILDKRTASVARLRQFGERVKTQSLELTPEQRERAVAKFIQQLPLTRRDQFRSLLEQPIDDIELIS